MRSFMRRDWTREWTREKLVEFENEIAHRFEEGKIRCPIHLSGGNEEELILIFEQVRDEDYVFSGHRSHYHYLLKGGSPQKLLDELEGLPTGMCGGKGRSMHLMDSSINFYSSAIIGGTPGIAVGVGLALKKKGSRAHVWCFVGDGGEDTGHFMEALRFARGRRLPVTFVVEDNDLAVESSKSARWKNYEEIQGGSYIIRYHYKMTRPHVGVGKFISF